MTQPDSNPTDRAPHSTDTASPETSPTDRDRRAALTKLGALAAWTAPVMLTLTLTPRTSAATPL
ncbi:hypothetical protein CKO25_17260 [Thiocapsa imhoffii]|uniref:Uncharacterized protein n=1 Tax=Thiocapsa imhoffii TaxID=382777 RepID=A0A9X0WKV0_9GAMM|nr:hypothetical protein [Thiocapsa imhoffii]MBK1646361.1 hypothetical protein [Thiocapsa imhoffii]